MIRPTRVLGLGLVGALTIAAIGVIIGGQLWLDSHHRTDVRRHAVTAAATKAVTAALSYDYRHLAADKATTEAQLSGDVLKQYRQVQTPLAESAPALHAVVVATVVQKSVLRVAGDSAAVLLFVDQRSTSTRLPGGRLDQSRVLVTLVRRHGHWLVDALKAV